jgi:hypothetical protein
VLADGSAWAALARDVLGAASTGQEGRPAGAEPLAALLATVDETGEIRAIWRARHGVGWQTGARPPMRSAYRLRNRLSSSWLPTFTAA